MNRRALLKAASAAAIFAAARSDATVLFRGSGGANFVYSGNISIGVYNSSGVLVRTIYSAKAVTNFSFAASVWDGTLDDGSVAPSGSYTIKLLTSQVAYTWEGVVGNTSDSFSANYQHASDVMFGMTIAGSNIYYCCGYVEAYQPTFKATTAAPNTASPIVPVSIHLTGPAALFCDNDGTNIYWAGYNSQAQTQSIVYATSIAADALVTFSSGTNVSISGVTYSCIDPVTNASGQITGFAVQKTANYLFVSRSGLNSLHVSNRSTGALAQSLTFASAGALCIDGTDHLWIAYVSGGNPVVEKYTVNGDGTLTIVAGSTITGLSAPLALAVSPDNSTLLVVDGGASQQVKAFSNSVYSSTPTWTYGTAGGYSASAAVTNSKFMFKAAASQTFLGASHVMAFVAFAPDGTWWLGDAGNWRNLHFTAGPTPSYIEQIAWIPAFYSANVDPNAPTRAFANQLEFTIDYTKALGPANGSWVLANNWSYNWPADYTDQSWIFNGVSTLSNARTYCLARSITTGGLQIFEILAPNSIRATGVTFPNPNAYMAADGTIIVESAANPTVWTKYTLTGFDGSNNPTYSSATLATGPAMAATDPQPYVYTHGATIQTTAGILPTYNGDLTNHGYHLGGVDPATGAWAWKALPIAPTNHNNGMVGINPYGAQWPSNGYYDISSNQVSGGFNFVVSGNNIFAQYFGEGYGGGMIAQTNKFFHYNSDGLMVGEFGVIGNFSNPPAANAGMAGNASNISIATSNGATYLYQNDESWHGGLHRWRIDNLGSIAETSLAVTWSSGSYVPPTPSASDKLAGLPFNAGVPASSGSWTRSPTTDVTTDVFSEYWVVKTNVIVCDSRQSPDITAIFNSSTNATRYISCALGSHVSSWALSASIILPSRANDGAGTYYVDVLDASNKVLARLLTTGTTIAINGTTVYSNGDAKAFAQFVSSPQALAISRNGASLNVQYGGGGVSTVALSDGTADITTPTTLKISFNSGPGGNYTRTVIVTELNFS